MTDTKQGGLSAAIATTSLGFVVVQLDVSIVNVALDQIGKSLDAGMAGLSWVVDAYTLAFAAGLLSGGALGDRLGARRCYVIGLVVFMLASIGCGLAPGAGTLIAARAVQGVGAAILMPCSLALLTHACGDDAAARSKAIGLWTASGGVALAAAPAIGGALISLAGWPSIFLVNVPICLVAIWTAFRFLNETQPGEGGFDFAGQALGAIALFAATGAVIEAGAGGLTPLVITGAVAAVIAGAAFFVVESRVASPLLPLGFFRDATFSSATAVGFAVNFCLYGAIFLLGLYFQRTLGASPGQTGVAFLPLIAMLTAVNLLSGRLAARFGSRLPMTVGLTIGAIGFAESAAAPVGTSQLMLTLLLLPIFAGVGTAVPAMTSALIGSVPRSSAGIASGVLNTVRQTAGAMGVAVFGAFAAKDVGAGLHRAFWLGAALLAVAAAVSAFGIRPAGARSGGG